MLVAFGGGVPAVLDAAGRRAWEEAEGEGEGGFRGELEGGWGWEADPEGQSGRHCCEMFGFVCFV